MSGGVRFQRPWLPSRDAIEQYLAASRSEQWFSNFGPCEALLRARLTDATGRPCVTVCNASIGLMVTLAALRDPASRAAEEALLPSFAFAASAQAAIWCGLRPVFVDVHPDHWHLDPDALESALDAREGRVAAVIALSSFGVPPSPEVRTRWEAICARAGVPLLVDSAAGFGARASDGVPIGAQGDAEVVSFHALKPVTAGEGGAVFCRDAELADTLASLSNFAFDDCHQVTRPDGLNAKLSEPAAAIALASLDELEASVERRQTAARELLASIPRDFRLQAGSERGSWQFVPVTAPDPATRTAVLEEARRREIGVRTYYDPLHLMPGFAQCATADDLSVTESLAARMLSLPMAFDFDGTEISAVAELVCAAAGVSGVVRS